MWAFFLPTIALSQHWTNVSQGFNSNPKKFIADSTENLLYAFGNFTLADNKPVHYAAQYDGTDWDTIPILNNYYIGNGLIKFNNKIIFGSNPVLCLIGNQVDTIATFTWGAALGFIEYNSELYAFGSFDSINGVAAYHIARWDGSIWHSLDTTFWYPQTAIVCAHEYQGALYVGGTLVNWDGSIENLAKWNGISWQPVGGNALAGGFSSLSCFEVYNNDLYIAGSFTSVVGKHIARWNGFQWLPVSQDFQTSTSAIFDLQIFNGELYACGNFFTIDGKPIGGIAKWDGNQWCGFGQYEGSGLECMSAYNNELYLGGAFVTLDSDTMRHVAKWTGGDFTDTCSTIGISENEFADQFNFFPNPSYSSITLTYPYNISQVQIIDALGREFKTIILGASTTLQIDISDLPSGIYFLKLDSEYGTVTRKMIK